MGYFPSGLPSPVPTEEDAPFWESLLQGVLRFQQCADCRAVTHPPALLCPRCQSEARIWAAAPRIGILYSYTIVHRAAHPSVEQALPYNVALVEFPECDGIRLIGNVAGVPPDALRIGMRLDVFLEPAGDFVVARFRPPASH